MTASQGFEKHVLADRVDFKFFFAAPRRLSKDSLPVIPRLAIVPRFFHGRKKLLLTVSADLVATRYLTLKVLKPTLASSFIVLGKCSAGTISLSSQMRIVSFARGMVIFSFSRVSVDLPRHL